MQTGTDAELIAAYASSGDDSAFAELVSRHGAMVYRVCHSVLGNAQEAEDASQAAFVVLVRKARSLRRAANLAAWLYGVARLVALRARQARSSRNRREEEAVMLQRARQTEKMVDASDSAMTAGIYREVGGLSEVLRQAVILRYLEGRSEQEAANIVGCSPTAISTRASRGLAKLRKRLAGGGTVLGAVALEGLLAAQARAAAPASLLPSIVAISNSAATGAAVGTATGSVVLMAEGALKAMMLTKIKMTIAAAMGLAVLGTGGVFAVKGLKAAAAETDGQQGGTVAPVPAGSVVARGSRADDAFRKLRRLSIRVVVMPRTRLLVPPGFRFRAVEGKTLVEAVATYHRLKVVWKERNGCSYAILNSPAADKTVQDIAKDLKSEDAAKRSRAAWRAGSLADARLPKLLLPAAEDVDPRVARNALASLRRLGLGATLVLTEGDAARKLVLQDVRSAQGRVCAKALAALGICGGKDSLDILEKALKSGRSGAIPAVGAAGGKRSVKILTDHLERFKGRAGGHAGGIRAAVVAALGNTGEPDAFAPLAKILEGIPAKQSGPWDFSFKATVNALGHIGGEKACALLRKVAADKKGRPGWRLAIAALAIAEGEKALPLIEKTMRENKRGASWFLLPLARAGGPRAFGRLQKALASGEWGTTLTAATGLGELGGERAMPLLRNLALAKGNSDIRIYATRALYAAGGDVALKTLGQLVSDADKRVRPVAARELVRIGGEKVKNILEAKALAAEDCATRLVAARWLACNGGELAALGVFERLAGFKTDGGDRMARIAANNVLTGLCSDPEAEAFLRKALKSTNRKVQLEAALALVRAGDQESLKLVEDILNGADATARREAAAALASMGHKKGMAVAEEFLNAKDPESRLAAAAALAAAGHGKALTVLNDALADANRKTRNRAIFALKKAGQTGSKKALALLADLLDHKDPTCHWTAGRTLMATGGPGVRDAVLPKLRTVNNYFLREQLVDWLKANFGDDDEVKKALADLPPLAKPTRKKRTRPGSKPNKGVETF